MKAKPAATTASTSMRKVMASSSAAKKTVAKAPSSTQHAVRTSRDMEDHATNPIPSFHVATPKKVEVKATAPSSTSKTSIRNAAAALQREKKAASVSSYSSSSSSTSIFDQPRRAEQVHQEKTLFQWQASLDKTPAFVPWPRQAVPEHGRDCCGIFALPSSSSGQKTGGSAESGWSSDRIPTSTSAFPTVLGLGVIAWFIAGKRDRWLVAHERKRQEELRLFAQIRPQEESNEEIVQL